MKPEVITCGVGLYSLMLYVMVFCFILSLITYHVRCKLEGGLGG
jgi:hypothetical protein